MDEFRTVELSCDNSLTKNCHGNNYIRQRRPESNSISLQKEVLNSRTIASQGWPNFNLDGSWTPCIANPPSNLSNLFDCSSGPSGSNRKHEYKANTQPVLVDRAINQPVLSSPKNVFKFKPTDESFEQLLGTSNSLFDSTRNFQVNSLRKGDLPQKTHSSKPYLNNKIINTETTPLSSSVPRLHESLDGLMNTLQISESLDSKLTSFDNNLCESKAQVPSFSWGQKVEEFPQLTPRHTKKSIKTGDKVVSDRNIKNLPRKPWKPKSYHPISFNLIEALKCKPEKSKKVLKKVDSSSNRVKNIGNILDSDQPKRRKGKVRPNKIPRPSKLKRKLLLDRRERRKLTYEKKDSVIIKESQIIDISHPINSTPDSINSDSINSRSLHIQCSTTNIEFESNKPGVASNDNPIQKEISTNLCSVDNEIKNAINIHSRRFREYCTNCLTDDLILNVCNLLEKMAFFQDRMFARDPIKAQGKRRYVAGIHQTNKYLKVKKVKMLIIAPDLERSPGEGGLDEKISNFKEETEIQGLPCVFGPRRKQLGKAVFKKSLVSCVAVLNYEGAEELFSKVLVSLEDAKSKYLKLIGESTELQQTGSAKCLLIQTE